jgi:hypothetical protein
MAKKIRTKLALILAISLSTTPVLAMKEVKEQENNQLVTNADSKGSSEEINLASERFSEHIDGLDDCATLLPIAGEKTLRNFILVGCYAIGRVLYTWGGGWNVEDDGASKLAKTIGLANSILDFTRSHYSENKLNTEGTETEKIETNGEIKECKVRTTAVDENGKLVLQNFLPCLMFKYIYDGFDCSGFLGWVIYNTLNKKDRNEGYVGSSTTRAEFFSKNKWGELKEITKEQIENDTYELYPGDIVSIPGHVYISLGKCKDGSVVLLHSSPPGVWIMGTTDKDGNENSDAIKLAEKYGQKYPKAYKWLNETDKRGVKRQWDEYLAGAKRFVWYVDGKGVLTDQEGIQKMSPEQVLDCIFVNPNDRLETEKLS